MFSKDFLRQMWQFKLDGKTNSLRMLALQFELAVTLSHEAVHAIRHASNWQARRQGVWCRERGVQNDHWMDYEPFFEGQLVAECVSISSLPNCTFLFSFSVFLLLQCIT